MQNAGRLFSMGLGLFILPGLAGATSISLDDLTLAGDATYMTTGNGDMLRLTPAVPIQVGSAFLDTTVDLTTLSTSFQFRISEPGGLSDGVQSGGDGITFVMQTVPTSLGSPGAALGYTGSPSVAVEFDTYQNPSLQDPSSNHVGILTNGSVSHGPGSPYTAHVAPRFDDGEIWYAWIDYVGTTLEVRVNQTDLRPHASLLSRDLDMVHLFGTSNIYMGFTGATYAAWGNHDILAWDIGSNAPVPEPTSMILLGLGLAGIGARRFRND